MRVLSTYNLLSTASRAVDVVRSALPYMTIGPPIIHYGPGGEVHVDVPLMYNGFAVDRMHYDPYTNLPSPKGRPVHAFNISVDPNTVRRVFENALREFMVIPAVEYREPERAVMVPIAWRLFIVAHVRVSIDTYSIVPDYKLTEEVMRLGYRG